MATEESGRPRQLYLSVIVPALNEEHALGPTLDKLLAALPRYFARWEILVFNDGSTDATGEVADRHAARARGVRVFHHSRPVSLGGVFRRGLDEARGDHVIMIHGQNDITVETLERIFSVSGVDLVIPYQTNGRERPWFRFLLSRLFVFAVNRMSGLRLRYYNHYVLYRREVLRGLDVHAYGYAFQAGLLIRLIRDRGCTYREVPVRDDFSHKRKSHALRPRNVVAVGRFFLRGLA